MNLIALDSTETVVNLLLTLCLILAITVAAIELMKLINFLFRGRK